MAFGLKGNGTAFKQRSVVELWLGVFQDGFSINYVFDRFASANLDLNSHPLVAVIGLALAAYAMTLEQLLVHHDIRTGGAQVGGGPLALTLPSEKLNLDGVGKVLPFVHAFGGLAVKHDPAVAKSPTRTIRSLLAKETIFDPEEVMRERGFVKHMPKSLVEILVLVVGHPDYTVLHRKRVVVVDSGFVATNFDRPIGQVLAVEELNPFALFLGRMAEGGKEEQT